MSNPEDRDVPAIDLATAFCMIADSQDLDLTRLAYHLDRCWDAHTKYTKHELDNWTNEGHLELGPMFLVTVDMLFFATQSSAEVADLIDTLREAADAANDVDQSWDGQLPYRREE